MDPKQYLRVVSAHWALIGLVAVACTLIAALYAWTREPIYASDVQLFVSASPDAEASSTDVYQGGLAAQARASSYAELVSSPPVLEEVASRIGDPTSEIAELQSKISTSVPTETVLIDVKVRDGDPVQARDIAEALGEEFPEYVADLEGGDRQGSPVELSVTSPATLPTSPESPNKPLYLVLGLLVGLTLGLGAAVLRELFDRRIRDHESTEALAGAPVLSEIPYDAKAKRRPLVVVEDPDSPQAEAYRRLRTYLRAATIDKGRHSLLLTSAVPGEGKTLVAANLAFAFAQAGHRVVLVDADMRRQGLGELLGLEQGRGLSELLSGETELEEPFHREHQLPLEVLSSGRSPANPSELLDSDAFVELLETLTKLAEIVIVDSPALLPVTDAAIIARQASAVVMVARASSTRAEQLDIAAEAIRAVGKQPIGAILNGVPRRTGPAYGYGRRTEVEFPAPEAPVWTR